MSNELTYIIEGVKNGTITLTNPKDVKMIERINNKTFKEIVENDIEALYPFKQLIAYVDADGSQKIQHPFGNDEIKEVAKVVKDLDWIPSDKGWDRPVAVGSEEGKEIRKKNPSIIFSATQVWEIPSIPGIDYSKGGTIFSKGRAKTHRVPASQAQNKWHSTPSVPLKSKKSKKSKTGNNIYEMKERYTARLEKAKKAGDEAEIAMCKDVISNIDMSLKEATKNGAKAIKE